MWVPDHLDMTFAVNVALNPNATNQPKAMTPPIELLKVGIIE